MLVDIVSVEVPEPVTDVGLKLALDREGNPLTLKLTTPLNPPEPVTVTMEVACDPRVTVCELGVAEIEKLEFETTRATVVE